MSEAHALSCRQVFCFLDKMAKSQPEQQPAGRGAGQHGRPCKIG